MSEFTIDAPVGFLSDGSPAANRVNDAVVVQFLLNAIPASRELPTSCWMLTASSAQSPMTPSVAFSSSSSASWTIWSSQEDHDPAHESGAAAVPAGVTVANEELRSWATRRTPQWNSCARTSHSPTSPAASRLSSDSCALLPPNYRANLVKAFSTILNPGLAPRARGISPFDLYHCHVMVPAATASPPIRPGDPTTRSRHEGRAVPAAGQRHVGRDRHDHDRCTGPGVPAASRGPCSHSPGSWPRVLHSVPASGSSTTASRERHRPAWWNAIQRPSSLLALARAYAGAGRRAVRADDFSGPGHPPRAQRLASSSTSSGSHVVPGSRLSLSALTGLPEADLI